MSDLTHPGSPADAPTAVSGKRPAGAWRVAWRTFFTMRVGCALVVITVLVAVLGPLMAPHGPNVVGGAPFQGPDGSHPFGTDAVGRDVLSRFLGGGLTSLTIPVIATIIGFAVGTWVGLWAAIDRRWVDILSMRIVDVVLSFPAIILVLVLITGLGSHIWLLVGGVALTTFPGVSRIVRGAALEVVTLPYVECAVARGERMHVLLMKEVLPNIRGPLIAAFGLYVPSAVVLTASLSFLGFGIQPPQADWAVMIKENSAGMTLQPWSVVPPIAALAVLTVGVNLVGDALARAAGQSTVIA